MKIFDEKFLEKSFNLSVLDIQIQIFEEIDSTNLEAKRKIVEGLSADTLLVAGTQTAGRGRISRSWFSPKGGLYFSLICRPRLGPSFAPLHSLLCGCAVAKSIQALGVEKVHVKWPNDILVMEHKIAGILNELVSLDAVDSWVILGIGINQNIAIDEFPEEFAHSSTSIQGILGKETSPESLLISVISEIDNLFCKVETERSFASVLDEWRQLSGTLGRRVRVDDGREVFTGIAEELLDDGSLVINTKQGREKISIGDVTHLRSD